MSGRTIIMPGGGRRIRGFGGRAAICAPDRPACCGPVCVGSAQIAAVPRINYEWAECGVWGIDSALGPWIDEDPAVPSDPESVIVLPWVITPWRRTATLLPQTSAAQVQAHLATANGDTSTVCDQVYALHQPGHCPLYLWHEGGLTMLRAEYYFYVARLPAFPDSIQLYADCDTGFHCDPAPSVTTYNVFDELFTAMLNYSSPDGTGGWLVADARGRVRINLSVPGTYTTVDQVVAAMVEDEQYGTLEIEHPFPVLIPGTTGLMLQYLNKAIGSLEWDATGTQTFPLVWIGDRFRQINVVRSASGGWVQSDEPCLFKEVDTELEVDNRTYDLSGNHGGITYLFGPGDGP